VVYALRTPRSTSGEVRTERLWLGLRKPPGSEPREGWKKTARSDNSTLVADFPVSVRGDRGVKKGTAFWGKVGDHTRSMENGHLEKLRRGTKHVWAPLKKKDWLRKSTRAGCETVS